MSAFLACTKRNMLAMRQGGVPKWLRERSAKPRCSGSNPLAASSRFPTLEFSRNRLQNHAQTYRITLCWRAAKHHKAAQLLRSLNIGIALRMGPRLSSSMSPAGGSERELTPTYDKNQPMGSRKALALGAEWGLLFRCSV
jgi:hypothetical protein